MQLPHNSQKYVAEFLGTYMLVFSIGCNVLAGSRIWLATSIASTLMVCVYIFGDVSGAHLNPAVSVSLALSKKMEWKECALYCVIQTLAGILAAFSYGLILWEVFTLKPAKGYDWWQAGLAEMLYTCMLCFVVLHVRPSGPGVPEFFEGAEQDPFGQKRNGAFGNQYFGLAIGFVLMAAIPSGGHISGGCFNPAVALGIDMSSALLGFHWWIAYIAFELAGAAMAAGLFSLTDPASEKNRLNPMRANLVSEFVGTFFLVLTVGLNVIGKSNAPVFSIAAALMVMVYALGRVSGGHFNPAVTLAVLARNSGLKARDALYYWIAQFLGGAAGAIMYTIMEHGKTFPLSVGKGFGWPHVAVAEMLFTFVLCYVVLAVATTKVTKTKTQFFGLAIGSCVTSGGIAIGTISGGVLNPAVAFGVSLTSLFGGGNFWHVIPYMLFEFLAGGFAAAIFMLTRPSEFGKA